MRIVLSLPLSICVLFLSLSHPPPSLPFLSASFSIHLLPPWSSPSFLPFPFLPPYFDSFSPSPSLASSLLPIPFPCFPFSLSFCLPSSSISLLLFLLCFPVENEFKQVSDTCLTPVYSVEDPNSGVNIEVETITNISILTSWKEPTIPLSCKDTVFSYPPLMYIVDVRIQMFSIPGYPVVSCDGGMASKGKSFFTMSLVGNLTSAVSSNSACTNTHTHSFKCCGSLGRLHTKLHLQFHQVAFDN